MSSPALSFALHRERWIIGTALAAITALALCYLWWLATGFDMSDMMSPAFVPWSAWRFSFMLLMWIVMMIGMMTPSVAPMILLYGAISAQRAPKMRFAAPGWFLAGYLFAWTGFAVVATFLQWLLEWCAVVTPMMAGTSSIIGGIVLVSAGVYQWLPVKHACLSACQSPMGFVQRHGGFRPDPQGAARLGLLHGLYCIGCCWAVMLLLFAFGVMNLAWIAGLMILVLVEKFLPWPRTVTRISGVAAIVIGLLMAFSVL